MNVTTLVDPAGDALERYTYTPYGAVAFRAPDWSLRASSTHANATLYTGRTLDAETGFYFYRARYYSAELGRFVARDPLRYRGRDFNLYRYVYNSPVLYVDPFGLDVWVENTTAVNGWHRRICVDTYDSNCNKNGKYCVSFGLAGEDQGSSGSGSSNNGGSSDSDSSGDSSTSGDEGLGNGGGTLPGGNENPNGDGIVYEDMRDRATKEVSRRSTSCGCDAAVLDYLKSLVGTRGDYGVIFGENCRDFSSHAYDEIGNRIKNGDMGKCCK